MSESTSIVDNLTDEICQQRCEEFAAITNTDTALAQCYLQDREWDVQVSINDFFEDKKKEEDELKAFLVALRPTQTNGGRLPIASISDDDDKELPEQLTLISWNIDGLEEKNLKLRTKAICKIIIKTEAHIVFLQEVIPETQAMLEKYLPQYQLVTGGDVGYYTVTLLRRGLVSLESSLVVPFPSSSMSRNLNVAHVKFIGIPLCLVNTHLESTADFAEERKKQLAAAFEFAASIEKEKAVILGGDLNLRDKELTSVGQIPLGFVDLWEATGKKKECAYTWDLTRNDNLVWNGRFKPRMRFDRLYLRSNSRLMPTYFGLLGLERLRPHTCFPSDHWGLMTFLKVQPKA